MLCDPLCLHPPCLSANIGLFVGNNFVAFLQIKLADKNAALEKLEREAKMSIRKVEELQNESVSMDFEITVLMQMVEELSRNSSVCIMMTGSLLFITLNKFPQ